MALVIDRNSEEKAMLRLRQRLNKGEYIEMQFNFPFDKEATKERFKVQCSILVCSDFSVAYKTEWSSPCPNRTQALVEAINNMIEILDSDKTRTVKPTKLLCLPCPKSS